MAKLKLVTFDCANTLVWTDWSPRIFLMRSATSAGLTISLEEVGVYESLFVQRQAAFWEANRQRTDDAWRQFWLDLGRDWLLSIGREVDFAERLQSHAESDIDHPNSPTFRRFDDVLPALALLRSKGIQIAVLSNWDHSLHRCLAAQGLGSHFDAVFASLEWGVEKPDSRFFQVALDHFAVSADEMLHIGDDVHDDFEGGEAAGIKTLLLDRTHAEVLLPKIQSLADIPLAFSWFD